MGSNEIRQIDVARFEISTPYGTFEINGYTPRLSSHGVLFPFNNCGLEVTTSAVNVECFVPVEDNKFGVAFETTFSGTVGVVSRR